MPDTLKNKIYGTDIFRSLGTADKEVILSGLQGSLLSFLVDFIHEKINKRVVYISSSSERIYRMKGDLDLLETSDNIPVFSSDKNTESEEFTRTLNILTGSPEFVVLIHSDEISKRIIKKDIYKNSLIKLVKGQEFLFEELIEKLGEYGFVKKDFVDETGDFSVRGGIVDLFPEHFDSPVRVEFFGETIESLREFDISSQRSLKEITEITFGISAAADESENTVSENNTDTIKDYMPEDSVIIFDNYDPDNPYTDKDNFKCAGKYFVSMFRETGGNSMDFSSRKQPDFHSSIKQLYKNLNEHVRNGYEVHLMSSDKHQSERLKSLIEDNEEELMLESDEMLKISDRIIYHDDSLQEGFIFPATQIVIYTEHQIFGRYFRQVRKRTRKFRGMTFDEIKELNPGDYVVHRDFGV
ncbi:MAG: hypothetical protein MUE56_04160, partial [Ignavibacteria bacterium]|nr:hypothetical protein [Ignavibacteria bacterium]